MNGLTEIERMNLKVEIKAAAKARVRKDGTIVADLHDFSWDCPECGARVRVYEFDGKVEEDGLIRVECDHSWNRDGCHYKGWARLGK